MKIQEESWAAVDVAEEMNYDSRPSLLPDLKKLKAAGEQKSEDKFSELDSSVKKNPRFKELWKRLPDVGPYRIMLTNLPRDIDATTLKSELSQHKSTAKIDHKPPNTYCYLLFNNKEHCLECVNLYGLRIQNCAVQLKITKTEQQAEIRRSNTARNSARASTGTATRFKHLSGRTARGETTKHRHPVTGSIRKKRSSNRSNQSSSQSKPPTNPWGDSNPKLLSRSNRQPANRNTGRSAPVQSPAPRRHDDDRGLGRSERSPNYRRNDGGRDFSRRDDRDPFTRGGDRDFSRRDEQDNSFSRGDRDNFRRNNDRDNFRRNDRNERSDDRGNFRNRENRFGGDRSDDDRGNFRSLNKGRKLREDDGRADEALNWRNRTQKPARKSPRDPIPARSEKAIDRSRVTRGDPTRLDPDTRTQNSTQQQRRTTQTKKEQEEKMAAKKKNKNAFAALLQEEED